MENQNNLSERELEMIQKGKKVWDLDVLNKMDGGRVKSSTIKDLIGKVIENTWDQAKKFYTKDNSIAESNLTSQIEEISIKTLNNIQIFLLFTLSYMKFYTKYIVD